jgi:hypothetical protein
MKMMRSVRSLEEALKLATGEVNRDCPHLVVPLYMGLALPMTYAEGLRCVSPAIGERIAADDVEMVAIAKGQMQEPGTMPTAVQFILLYGKFAPDDPKDYWSFSTLERELEMAVLMNGDGMRYRGTEPLTREEALTQWMAGFLNWNCGVPGLYQIRYAFIGKQEEAKPVG